MGVALGRPDIGVPEHLLHAPQVGASLEQVRRKRVPQEVRVDAAGLEPGPVGEPSEDEERARAGECPAARIEEEVGPVPMVEMWSAEREVAAQRLGGGAAERASETRSPAP